MTPPATKGPVRAVARSLARLGTAAGRGLRAALALAAGLLALAIAADWVVSHRLEWKVGFWHYAHPWDPGHAYAAELVSNNGDLLLTSFVRLTGPIPWPPNYPSPNPRLWVFYGNTYADPEDAFDGFVGYLSENGGFHFKALRSSLGRPATEQYQVVVVVAPHWFVLLVLGSAAWWLSASLRARRRAAKRVRRGLCGCCGYDLRGTPGRCPECGTETSTMPPVLAVDMSSTSVLADVKKVRMQANRVTEALIAPNAGGAPVESDWIDVWADGGPNDVNRMRAPNWKIEVYKQNGMPAGAGQVNFVQENTATVQRIKLSVNQNTVAEDYTIRVVATKADGTRDDNVEPYDFKLEVRRN